MEIGLILTFSGMGSCDQMNQPLVTCIIPFFNCEAFFAEAIASILAQSYPYWELFLVDDGSSDGSTAIALDYAQKYPASVHYLCHPHRLNAGTSASRNLAIDYAKGQYIAYLDHDDVWLPHKLAEQVAIMEAHPDAAMVYGRYLNWYSWAVGANAQQDFFLELGISPDTVIAPPVLLSILWRLKVQSPLPSNAMIRKSAFAEVGRFEPAFRSVFEDLVFFTKLELSLPVFVSSACWTKHRMNTHSASVSFCNASQQQRLPEIRRFFRWVESFLLAQGQKESEVWSWQQKAFKPYRHAALYFMYFGYLDLTMSLARKLLPANVRHHLWLKLGSKLYGQRIDKQGH